VSEAVEVRPAREADVPALARFLVEMEAEESGSGLDAATVERDLRALEPGPGFLIALADGGRIVGYAAHAMLYPSMGHGLAPLLFLKELAVSSDFRRRGVATRLMRSLARLARERGCTRLGWNTPRDNLAAQALYDGLGSERAEHLLSYRLGGKALDRLADG
jgi:ribosomal protein S18 acetylase RimI-like enzyme